MRYLDPSEQGGYTLVELIVSLAIFAIVMLSATSAYLSFINYNRRATQVSSLMNTLSFAVDSMARDIRTGKDYSCEPDETACDNSDQQGGVGTFYFKDADGCAVTYEFSSVGGIGTLTKSVASAAGCTAQNDAEVIGPAATPGVTLTSAKYYIRGVEPGLIEDEGDSIQSMTTMVLMGYTTIVDTGEQIEFSIETSATSRVPDAS